MNNPVLTKIIKTSDEGPLENHKWEYELYLPEWLSKWDVWDYWEKERVESMKNNLCFGDILFDIGSESGWMSALFGKYFVGGSNMILFEPSEKYWPTIRDIWNMNGLNDPKYCWNGFVGLNSKKKYSSVFDGVWPECSKGERIVSGMPYEYIHENNKKKIAITSLDDFSYYQGVIPRGITVDVEGAEIEVIKGSYNLLKENDILLWISIHPDLMLKNYKSSKEGLLLLLDKIGYYGELLGIDHEEHWLFRKKKNE